MLHFHLCFFLFEIKKMTDAVNHEISIEYVDESMLCLLLFPLHFETVFSGFQGVSVCCSVKLTLCACEFWREDCF